MDNNENKYNLDENTQRRKKFTIIGLVLLIVGGICVITGFVDFFVSMNRSMNGSAPTEGPTLFWLFFVGFPLIAGGFALVTFFNQGRLSRIAASQMAPVQKDVANYMLDGTKDTIGAVATEIGKGLNKSYGLDDIKKLKELLDMGAITPEEYEREKNEILNK